MARKRGGTRSGKRGDRTQRRPAQDGRPAVSRRAIERDQDTSRLRERAEGPAAAAPVDEGVNSPSEITSEGGSREGPGFRDEKASGEAQGKKAAGPRPPRSRRTDETLAQEIREILTNDPELDATDIEVEVEGGAVTLRGLVAGPDAKLLAEELVETLPGVREVHNRLRAELERE